MSFFSAVQACFANYATFRGRARRSEYWFFVLFMILCTLVAATLDGAIAVNTARHLNVFSTILSIVFFLPSLAVTARRLHDIGRSGWWMLISLVPIVGSIVLLVWLCTRGYEGPNRFGSDPIGPMQPGPAGAVA